MKYIHQKLTLHYIFSPFSTIRSSRMSKSTLLRTFSNSYKASLLYCSIEHYRWFQPFQQCPSTTFSVQSIGLYLMSLGAQEQSSSSFCIHFFSGSIFHALKGAFYLVDSPNSSLRTIMTSFSLVSEVSAKHFLANYYGDFTDEQEYAPLPSISGFTIVIVEYKLLQSLSMMPKRYEKKLFLCCSTRGVGDNSCCDIPPTLFNQTFSVSASAFFQELDFNKIS